MIGITVKSLKTEVMNGAIVMILDTEDGRLCDEKSTIRITAIQFVDGREACLKTCGLNFLTYQQWASISTLGFKMVVADKMCRIPNTTHYTAQPIFPYNTLQWTNYRLYNITSQTKEKLWHITFTPSIQDALFWHGLLRQSSMLSEQVSPVKPVSVQLHWYLK